MCLDSPYALENLGISVIETLSNNSVLQRINAYYVSQPKEMVFRARLETNCSSSLSKHQNVVLGIGFEVCEIDPYLSVLSTHIEAFDVIKNNDCGDFGATP